MKNIDPIYTNFEPPSTLDRAPTHEKRRDNGVVVTLAVVLMLSLLANVLQICFFFTFGRATLPEEPVRNCSARDVSTTSSAGDLTYLHLKFNDTLYIYPEELMNWTSSRNHCQELGGDLAVINSKEEHEIIGGKLNSTLKWIGLTDAEKEGDWFWVDQTPLSDLTWWKSPPDDYKVVDPLGEDCGVYYEGKWGDVSCSKLERMICEIPSTHMSVH